MTASLTKPAGPHFIALSSKITTSNHHERAVIFAVFVNDHAIAVVVPPRPRTGPGERQQPLSF